MKKYFIIIFFTFSTIVFSQFKGEENKSLDIRSGILSNNPISSIFSFIDMSKFSMNHSFGMSYTTFGNNGLALGVYTNHLAYQFSESLNFELDASVVNTPYNTFGDNFTNSVNGVYIDRARINYNPSDKFQLSLQFSNSPLGYYNRNSFYNYSPFSNYWFDE